jgi:hypothetical protein
MFGESLLGYQAKGSTALQFKRQGMFNSFSQDAYSFFSSLGSEVLEYNRTDNNITISLKGKDGRRPCEGENIILKVNNTVLKIPLSDLFAPQPYNDTMYSL